MPEFSTLIADAQGFYKALDKTNTREHWTAHKTTYDTRLKVPALALLDLLTPQLADLSGLTVTPKLFRPHRDVRFSKDKTPYNTHLHMIWNTAGEGRQSPAFFFGIGVDYVTAGGGIMEFDKPVLEDWRKFADLDAPRVLGITGEAEKAGFTFWEPALKRVPSPYPADHAAAHLLRMKGVVAGKDIGPDAALPDALMAAFRDLWPLNALLIQVAEA
jgi:uncharacterized protein (TIGR02453 family)